ncbi:MAG: group I intron-associated PD-(D/E)XK endonuclease, partial [Candidatus Omnitrophota bacterium]|nr:group I intron-associated PD-(D/E)XK endonuclease [Candidatus Omnitrophota bacterium]
MHHTKAKADIGLAKVISDLTIKGYIPCIPLSEHQPYDIVAIKDNGKAIKLQVKYAALKSNGTIEVRFRTSWTDRKGTHIRH